MDKMLLAVGAVKDKTGIMTIDPMTLIRNILYLCMVIAGFCFASGSYFSGSKDLPQRMAEVEKRQERMEAQFDNVISKLDSVSTDIREVRNVVLRNK